MAEQREESFPIAGAAAPVLRSRRTLSIVWIVPLVAVLIGIWLVYKTVSEKGPEITITFKSAEGLEAGKTKINYKDVDIGKVTAIRLSEDLSHVTVTAEMVPDAGRYLTEETRFWVVRPQITAGGVSGLGTLLSGAFIGIEPAIGGTPRRHFDGLERQPMVTGETAGSRYILAASRLGSLNRGSPIYFRQIRVGQVVDYQLEPAGDNVEIQIFIEAPYNQFVRHNTSFWLASGLDFNLTANGLRVDTESAMSLLIGGIAFANLTSREPGEEVEENALFTLFETYEDANKDRYTRKRDAIVEFHGTVRGLSIGAPVEFRGMRVGEVVDIGMVGNFDTFEFTIPVRVRLEPERLPLPMTEGQPLREREQRMLAAGFRAQLATGNLLTGQLFIDLDFHPDALPVESRYQNGMPIIPSVPPSTQASLDSVTRFVKRLDQMPLDVIGRDLEHSLAGLERLINGPDLRNTVAASGRVMSALESTSQSLTSNTLPALNETLTGMQLVLQDLDQWVSADAPLQGDVRETLQELAKAARAVRELADALERHPEALLQGKGGEGQ